MPKVKKEKYYVILSENKYIHGAFEHSKEGRAAAKNYVKKNSTKENKLFIKIR